MTSANALEGCMVFSLPLDVLTQASILLRRGRDEGERRIAVLLLPCDDTDGCAMTVRFIQVRLKA